MTQGIDLGGRTIFATEGVIAEAHGQQHFKVPMGCVSNLDGRTINGMYPLINPAAIFNAIAAAGIVFSGPAPFDASGECMRFMFEKDAKAFYAAFLRA